MSELLLCPFCGGEAETLTAESMYGGYLFGIMCNDCRSRGDVYDTEAEAITAWNSRAERTCKVTKEFVDIGGECMTDYSCCFNQPGWGHNYCPNCGAKVVDE